MSFAIQIKHQVYVQGALIQDDNTYTDAELVGVDTTISAGDTTFTNLSVDIEAVTAIAMLCSRDVTLTVNGSGTVISLKAGKMLVWTSDAYFSNPLGGSDMMSLKATLAAGADATFYMAVIQAST